LEIIYLIGFMGSGKTTVGQVLSEKLEVPFVDVDQEIEKRLGKRIVNIFEVEGESGFRKQETTVLRSIQNIPIVSTGGGIVEREENITFMKKSGIIVYLQTSFERITKRLTGDSSRPLWKGNEETRNLYQRRIKLYEACADIIVDNDELSIEEQVNFILSKV
jgi:shikimate kinase